MAEAVRFSEASQALFGDKSAAMSELADLVAECSSDGWDGEDALAIDALAHQNAIDLLRAWPPGFPLPEFAPEPDGSISFDWIASPDHMFSVSVGAGEGLAFAWLDGADRGHGVAKYDGATVPRRVLTEVKAIVDAGYSCDH